MSLRLVRSKILGRIRRFGAKCCKYPALVWGSQLLQPGVRRWNSWPGPNYIDFESLLCLQVFPMGCCHVSCHMISEGVTSFDIWQPAPGRPSDPWCYIFMCYRQMWNFHVTDINMIYLRKRGLKQGNRPNTWRWLVNASVVRGGIG